MTARRARGPREVRRARQLQRRRRLRVGALVAGVATLALLTVGALVVSRERPVAVPAPTADAVAQRQPEQDTLLLVRHGRDDGPATGVTLLAAGPGKTQGHVVFLPVGTLVDIPGFGLDRLGLAYQYGGAALVESSVENVLGIDVDATASVTPSALGAFLERSGGLELELDDRLVSRSADGSAQVRFEPGRQFLDGPRLAELWGFRQRGEPELAAFPRQQLVLSRLLDAAADDKVAAALVADGAPQLVTSAEPALVRDVVSTLVAARREEQLAFTLLPVTPFGDDDARGDPTYRTKPDEVRRLVAGPLAASVPDGGGPDAVRVQVLNGVGTPGIGQAVDRRLEGAGFRIVLTDNARSFDFDATRILVYDEDERSLQAANRVRERLGVGTIQVSRQPQSVVDLTIVVGADFASEGDPATEAPAAKEQDT